MWDVYNNANLFMISVHLIQLKWPSSWNHSLIYESNVTLEMDVSYKIKISKYCFRIICLHLKYMSHYLQIKFDPKSLSKSIKSNKYQLKILYNEKYTFKRLKFYFKVITHWFYNLLILSFFKLLIFMAFYCFKIFFTLEMHVRCPNENYAWWFVYTWNACHFIGNCNTNKAGFIILHLKCTSLFEHLYELSDNLIY